MVIWMMRVMVMVMVMVMLMLMVIWMIGLTVKFGLISNSAASPSSHRSSKLFRNL